MMSKRTFVILLENIRAIDSDRNQIYFYTNFQNPSFKFLRIQIPSYPNIKILNHDNRILHRISILSLRLIYSKKSIEL